jgi:tRNA G37 N-methylase Trm5
MMVVRINDDIKSYTSEIAKAKLLSHPSIRLILSDGGVMGEFRIRELEVIGGRKEPTIYTEKIPSEIKSTKVLIKESGRYISCDPKVAYYSTKLQTERLETLSFAKELRAELDRPLSICDPFCGVGPALSTLIAEEDLVGDLLASDLNSAAVELLFENLQRWDKRDYPIESENLQRYYDDRIVGLADATKIPLNPEYAGKWDLLLVNLPHRTVEFLPKLVPLLNRTNTSMIRGRVIVAESEIPLINQKINQILPALAVGKPKPELKIKRDYSSALRLCSFEAWIEKDTI